MKKILCLVLALLMVFGLCACGGGGDDVIESTDASKVSEAPEETKAERVPYDGVFKAGYAREDITPTELPIDVSGNTMTKIMDPLYATCVAVSDGENTALFITADVKNMGRDYCAAIRKQIKQMMGVAEANIMISATHNHSAPTPQGAEDKTTLKWTGQVKNKIVAAAKAAVADLADAEVYTGTGKTTGLAFVRRYIHEDGSFSGINMRNKSSSPVVKYESESDDTVQIIRFVRADKKDIVMVNWQAHVAHAIGMYPAAITADLVHHVRKTVEEENEDALIAYYQGASGNINLTVKVPKSGKYDGNYKKVGEALGDIILKTLDKDMQKVEAGKIYSTSKMLTLNYRSISDEDLARANQVVAAGPEGSAAYNAKLDELGFESHYEVSRIISLAPNKGGPSQQYFAAIGFGDVGFASIPYEMFDTNGMELKEASPYKMTFVLTCSGGMVGYVPSALSVPNKGYEVVVSNFEYGTAEMVVGEVTKMLKDVFEKN